jgi:hypothetical protein
LFEFDSNCAAVLSAVLSRVRLRLLEPILANLESCGPLPLTGSHPNFLFCSLGIVLYLHSRLHARSVSSRPLAHLLVTCRQRYLATTTIISHLDNNSLRKLSTLNTLDIRHSTSLICPEISQYPRSTGLSSKPPWRRVTVWTAANLSNAVDCTSSSPTRRRRRYQAWDESRFRWARPRCWRGYRQS